MRQELREMAQRHELVLIETRDRRWTITTITGGLILSGLTLAEVELVLRSDTPERLRDLLNPTPPAAAAAVVTPVAKPRPVILLRQSPSTDLNRN